VVIGLELDDHAADTVDQQSCADQFGRDIEDRAIEKRAAKARGRHRRKLHIPRRLSFRVGECAAREPGIQKHASVRSARGRSHEASCGWDRMRRPRPGRTPGRRREVARRPLHAVCQEHGHKGPPARLMARHRGVFLTAPGSRFVGTVQFSPQASHFGRSARRPRLSGRERGTTWRAISLALRDCGKRRQAYPRPRQTAWAITLGPQRHRKCCRLPTPVSTLQQF